MLETQRIEDIGPALRKFTTPVSVLQPGEDMLLLLSIFFIHFPWPNCYSSLDNTHSTSDYPLALAGILGPLLKAGLEQ